MFSIPQSTSFVAVFKAYLSSDHVSEATGKTIVITISKAGGSFANPNAGATNATEIANGWYKVTLDTTDTGTLGILALRGAVSGIDDVGDRFYVVKATNGGLTALPDVAAEGAGGLFTRGTGAGQINQPANGMIDANVVRNAGTAITAAAGVQEVKVASLATGAIVAGSFAAGAIDNAAIATDAIGSAELASSAVTEIQSGLSTLDAAAVRTAVGLGSANLDTQLSAIAGYIDTEVSAIKAKTDNLPASPAAVGDIPTANQNADALLDRANAIETGLTPRQAMRLLAAVDGGKLSGSATTTNTFRNAVADSKDRVVATVDASGNRTAITTDLT